MRLLDRPASDIIAVTMPCFGTTDRTRDNAVELSRRLGATLKRIDIGEAVKQHFRDIGQSMDCLLYTSRPVPAGGRRPGPASAAAADAPGAASHRPGPGRAPLRPVRRTGSVALRRPVPGRPVGESGPYEPALRTPPVFSPRAVIHSNRAAHFMGGPV